MGFPYACFFASFLAGARKEVLRKADEQFALTKYSKVQVELWRISVLISPPNKPIFQHSCKKKANQKNF
jgi:hypothetical protein